MKSWLTSMHTMSARLSSADNLGRNDELALAVKARRKERFFAQMRAGYAELTEGERMEEGAEAALWDSAAGDGLDDE